MIIATAGFFIAIYEVLISDSNSYKFIERNILWWNYYKVKNNG